MQSLSCWTTRGVPWPAFRKLVPGLMTFLWLIFLRCIFCLPYFLHVSSHIVYFHIMNALHMSRKRAEQWHPCQAVLGPGVRALRCSEGICVVLVPLLQPLALYLSLCASRVKGWKSFWCFPPIPDGPLPSCGTPMLKSADYFIHLMSLFSRFYAVRCLSLTFLTTVGVNLGALVSLASHGRQLLLL